MLSRVRIFALVASCALVATGSAPNSYITFNETAEIIREMGAAVSADVRPLKDSGEAGWDKWIRKQDADIRARLVPGDEDSLVNMMLFGTSFTRLPRITLESLARTGRLVEQGAGATSPEAKEFLETVNGRARDLISGMLSPAADERLVFARHFLEARGYKVTNSSGRNQAAEYLLKCFVRVLNEQSTYASVLERARLLGNPSEEFAARSTVFQTRGLSSDTSILPDFALDQTLKLMKKRGLLGAGPIHRVAIIGPGLDFTDKQDGYDFYPLQTIQPFAIIDSLLNLGLAKENDLHIVTLDISDRVNEHIQRAVEEAREGKPYTIQLPRDPNSGWKPELVRYWSEFGSTIGSPTRSVSIPVGVPDLRLRAVRIRPSVVRLVSSEDLNIVAQRLRFLPGDRKFDLVIATNIFVYYSPFEQALAMANVASMLSHGGYLLSNNGLPELTVTGMRSTGYNTVIYSDRPDDGDHIVWYQHTPGGR